ncbi:MAG: hypothetical protein DWB56_15555 [Candidatus Jettenia sp.]|uniref:Uncharacterized protein n=1 Tax=Candidatus Jettenia caeni TaxID=247490 RepID=I3IKG7_9BACT|nr:hypothetical protein [Candidatus Jettenia sp. AMX1]MBC6930346.1 hypothetical protein [Candidatus Jettenia sp.]NUN24689.1 hypothetical protein [Candidatus Jettenia caeni]KAA0247467.1 MAG: hypothetical protein EDM77_15045 [Candidatus Jettenia sp. AMX1]MCE7881943.1 hypothetical protein [Candidatus Jettenia sp. AMX1]MCQ3928501.1 hypothetical protein [Candidatus Jettenia sp.]
MLKKLSLSLVAGAFVFGFGIVNTPFVGSAMADHHYEEKKKEKKEVETDDGKTIEKKTEVKKKDGEKEIEKIQKTEKNY